jgi:hypothetical protein
MLRLWDKLDQNHGLLSQGSKQDYEGTLKQIDSVLKQLNGLDRVRKWLESRGYLSLDPVEYDPEKCGLVTLTSHLSFITFGLKDSTRNFLEFFISRNSILFDAMAAKRIPQDAQLDSELIEDIVQITSDFLQRLLQLDKLKLSEFDSLHSLQEKAGQNYATELQTVAAYFSTQVVDPNQARKQELAMESAFELLSIYAHLSEANECWDSYGLFGDERKRIQSALPSKADKHSDPSLVQVGEILAQLRLIFGKSFTSSLLEIFRVLLSAKDFVEFLADQTDFDATLAIVTRNMQGEENVQALLTTVSVIHKSIKVFIDCWNESRHKKVHTVTLQQVCDSFMRGILSEEDTRSSQSLLIIANRVQHLNNQLTTAMDKLSTIRVIFTSSSQASTAAIVSNIPEFVKSGHFQVSWISIRPMIGLTYSLSLPT